MAQGSVFEAQAGATAATTGRAAQSTTGRLQAVMVREADWQQTKRAAVFAGLDFLRGLGGTLFRNDALWNRHGSDILIPFYVPPLGAARASEEERHALKVATELALVWRGRNRGRRLTSGTPPSELLDLMQGVYTLECLGMADGSRDLRQQLEERCAAYGVEDFLRFDPAVGEPGGAVREVCLCGARPEAGARECPACRRPAVPMSRFDVWLEALVWTFHGCRMRIGLGACFFAVLQQLGQARSNSVTTCFPSELYLLWLYLPWRYLLWLYLLWGRHSASSTRCGKASHRRTATTSATRSHTSSMRSTTSESDRCPPRSSPRR